MFRGVFTALITPFLIGLRNPKTGLIDSSIDEKAFRRLIDWQIEQGVHGLVPVGTTGESPTLSHEEHAKVVEICVEQAARRVPILAGAGSNNTDEAIEFALHAEKTGADGLLVVTPYYNKPNQEGLYQHYAAIARRTALPIIIYNIPGRSVIDMTPQTMGRLVSDFKNIIGVKDATGKIERVCEQREECGADFVQFSGDDHTALSFNAQGGHGCISVTSNIAPKLCAELQEASLGGDYGKALKIHQRLAPLNRALFIEPNPAGVKYAAERLGKASHFSRLPIVPLQESTKAVIDKALAHAGLI